MLVEDEEQRKKHDNLMVAVMMEDGVIMIEVCRQPAGKWGRKTCYERQVRLDHGREGYF